MKRGLLCRLTAAVCILAAFLGGCKGRDSLSGSAAVGSYSLPEVMLLVATERNRYEQVYTDEIWQVQVEEGTTMEDYLLKQIRAFAEDVKVMNMIAKENDIRIEAAEKETLRQLSEEYYSQLSENDLAYTGASLENVQNIYEEYHLAGKVVENITKDVDLEISDNEAKVISVEQIVLDSPEEAERVLGLVQAENADFKAIAAAESKEPDIELSVGRGEMGSSYEAAAFALEEGQISGVVEEGGTYYIIKCTNAYDEEATLERKSQLSLARKDKAFREMFESFKAENPVEFDDTIWEGIDFKPEDKTETTNFFQLYQEYFPEK